MDRHKSAMKRNRQNVVRNVRNRSRRSYLRNHLREFNQLLEKTDVEAAKEFIPKLKTTIDKAVSEGILHKNKAARHKSRLSRKLQVMCGPETKVVI